MYWEVNAQRKPRVYVLRLVYTVEEDGRWVPTRLSVAPIEFVALKRREWWQLVR